VAETLEVVTLCRATLGPIILDFNVNAGKAGKLARVIRKRGKDMVPMGLLGEGYLFVCIDVKTQLL
jgi:hypothetical protein